MPNRQRTYAVTILGVLALKLQDAQVIGYWRPVSGDVDPPGKGGQGI